MHNRRENHLHNTLSSSLSLCKETASPEMKWRSSQRDREWNLLQRKKDQPRSPPDENSENEPSFRTRREMTWKKDRVMSRGNHIVCWVVLLSTVFQREQQFRWQVLKTSRRRWRCFGIRHENGRSVQLPFGGLFTPCSFAKTWSKSAGKMTGKVILVNLREL